MTYQQNNPEVDKEKDAFVSDESLFPNDEMKSEKSRKFCNPFYCFVLSYCLYSLILFFSFQWERGLVAFVLLGIHIISFVIATILLWSGMVNSNKSNSLYH